MTPKRKKKRAINVDNEIVIEWIHFKQHLLRFSHWKSAWEFSTKIVKFDFWNLSEHIIKKNRPFFGAQLHTSNIQRARRGKRALNRYHDWFILMAFFFAMRSCFIVGKFLWLIFFVLFLCVCISFYGSSNFKGRQCTITSLEDSAAFSKKKKFFGQKNSMSLIPLFSCNRCVIDLSGA